MNSGDEDVREGESESFGRNGKSGNMDTFGSRQLGWKVDVNDPCLRSTKGSHYSAFPSSSATTHTIKHSGTCAASSGLTKLSILKPSPSSRLLHCLSVRSMPPKAII